MKPGVLLGLNVNRLCGQVAHHKLSAAKSSKPLGCASTVITHHTVGAKLVTSYKYAQAYLQGTTKLCQLLPRSTHHLTLYSNVSPSGHTSDLTEGSRKHLSADKNHRAVSWMASL